MSSSRPNPYAVLGITGKATEKEIKSAYKSLVKQWHPDVVGGVRAEHMIRQLNVALDDLKEMKSKADSTLGRKGYRGGGGGGGGVGGDGDGRSYSDDWRREEWKKENGVSDNHHWWNIIVHGLYLGCCTMIFGVLIFGRTEFHDARDHALVYKGEKGKNYQNNHWRRASRKARINKEGKEVKVRVY